MAGAQWRSAHVQRTRQQIGDLDRNAVDKQLERERKTRRSGPIAENLLRDAGIVAARNY